MRALYRGPEGSGGDRFGFLGTVGTAGLRHFAAGTLVSVRNRPAAEAPAPDLIDGTLQVAGTVRGQHEIPFAGGLTPHEPHRVRAGNHPETSGRIWTPVVPHTRVGLRDFQDFR